MAEVRDSGAVQQFSSTVVQGVWGGVEGGGAAMGGGL